MEKARFKWVLRERNRKIAAKTEVFTEQQARRVRSFHSSFKEYSPTPLIELTSLAQHLGIKNLFVKDESYPRDPESFDSMRRSLAGLLAYSTSAAYRLPDGSVTYDKPLLHTVTRSRRSLTCFPILRFLTAPAASYLISHNLHKHYSSLSEIINCFSAIFSSFLHYFARFFINNR